MTFRVGDRVDCRTPDGWVRGAVVVGVMDPAALAFLGRHAVYRVAAVGEDGTRRELLFVGADMRPSGECA